MNNVKKNLAYNFVYQITVMILPLITAPYISRIVGAEGLGIYSYNYSIALYFVYFAMLGISNYGNRCIAKVSNDVHERNKVFSSIYLFQIFVSLTVFIIYIIYAIFGANNKEIVFIMTFHVMSAIFDVSWFYFGMQEFKITSLRQLIIKIITFISIFAFVKKESDLWIYTLIMSLGYFISALSLWIMLWKKIKFEKVSIKNVMKHLKPCLILFIPIIATSVYRTMDKIMIGNLSNMLEVGYYENAEKLIFVSLGLLGTFATVIMPKISNLISQEKDEEANQLFDKSMEFALFLGMAITFGIASVSKEFIPIFFGESFNASINLSIALCCTIPFITWSTIIRNLYLIPHEKDNIYVKSVIIGATLNIFFNIIFIRKYGAFGAIVGTLAAEMSLAIYQTLKIRNEINLKKYLRQATIFMIIGSIMFVIVRAISKVFQRGIMGLIVEIVVGAFFYILLFIIYKLVIKHIK